MRLRKLLPLGGVLLIVMFLVQILSSAPNLEGTRTGARTGSRQSHMDKKHEDPVEEIINRPAPQRADAKPNQQHQQRAGFRPADTQHEELTPDSDTERVPLVNTNHFESFELPTDAEKWQQAKKLADSGAPLLLQTVRKQTDLDPSKFTFDSIQFLWVFKLMDLHFSYEAVLQIRKMLAERANKEPHEVDPSEVFDYALKGNVSTWATVFQQSQNKRKARVILLGSRKFSTKHPSTYNHFSPGGRTVLDKLQSYASELNSPKTAEVQAYLHTNVSNKAFQSDAFSPDKLVGLYKHHKTKRNVRKSVFSSPVVLVGLMNENWGYLSSYFTNRTMSWGFRFGKHLNRIDAPYNDQEFQPVLDDPNVLAVVVNQHVNITHPKLISVPLGVKARTHVSLLKVLNEFLDTNDRKEILMLAASSEFGTRKQVTNCIKEQLRPELVSAGGKSKNYQRRLAASKFVLCPSGMGIDSYRIWEVLLSGSIPVVERGFGMDRTFAFLPVLIVDDYKFVTEEMLNEAYTQALYIALTGGWRYDHMLAGHWAELINRLGQGDVGFLQTEHPIQGRSVNFTRPLLPFDCHQGCGPGTKRTPGKYCSVRAEGYQYHRNSLDNIVGGVVHSS